MRGADEIQHHLAVDVERLRIFTSAEIEVGERSAYRRCTAQQQRRADEPDRTARRQRRPSLDPQRVPREPTARARESPQRDRREEDEEAVSTDTRADVLVVAHNRRRAARAARDARRARPRTREVAGTRDPIIRDAVEFAHVRRCVRAPLWTLRARRRWLRRYRRGVLRKRSRRADARCCSSLVRPTSSKRSRRGFGGITRST